MTVTSPPGSARTWNAPQCEVLGRAGSFTLMQPNGLAWAGRYSRRATYAGTVPGAGTRPLAGPDSDRAAAWDTLWADYEHARRAVTRYYYRATPTRHDLGR
jgi:uncharacterized iron-regulated membrane protein